MLGEIVLNKINTWLAQYSRILLFLSLIYHLHSIEFSKENIMFLVIGV